MGDEAIEKQLVHTKMSKESTNELHHIDLQLLGYTPQSKTTATAAGLARSFQLHTFQEPRSIYCSLRYAVLGRATMLTKNARPPVAVDIDSSQGLQESMSHPIPSNNGVCLPSKGWYSIHTLHRLRVWRMTDPNAEQ